jgi:hypothetical protein
MQSVKKRGKVNESIVTETALLTSSQIIDNPKLIPSNLILHLKRINTLDQEENPYLQNDMAIYNPDLSTPDAYDPVEDNCYSYVGEKKVLSETKTDETIQGQKTLCWWCCHSYSNETIRIPTHKISDQNYKCIGAFCSAECGVAFILESGNRFGNRLKIHEFFHEMTNSKIRIKPAPKRELLQVFGGELDIQSFRSNPNVQLVYPPVVSLKMQMDEIQDEKNVEWNDDSNISLITTTHTTDVNLVVEQLIDKRKKKKKTDTHQTLDQFWV